MTDLVWADAATPDEGAAQVIDLFRDASGYESRGVWSASGCVNVIGEHVDYSGGPCVPIALPYRAYVVLSPREDRMIHLISPQTREVIDVFDLDVIGPKGTPGEVINHWTAYFAGVVWALEQAGYGPLPGFDVILWSCVSLGGGLSSGVAFERATAAALDEMCLPGLMGMIEAPNDEGRKVLVDAACVAENQAASANTGGLDQTASLRCREGHAPVLDCRDMSMRQVPSGLSAVGLELLVIDTYAKHSLADGQYGSRCANCEGSARTPGVGQLVEVEDLGEATVALGSEHLVARIRHVVSEIVRTRVFIELLDEGPLDDTCLAVMGALLNNSHDSLRDDYEVSCEELGMIAGAARAAGARSARMTGGGFGRSVVALVNAHAVEGVVRAVATAYAERGWESSHFIRSPPGVSAGRLD